MPSLLPRCSRSVLIVLGRRLVVPLHFSHGVCVCQCCSMSGWSICAGGCPPALFLHSAGRGRGRRRSRPWFPSSLPAFIAPVGRDLLRPGLVRLGSGLGWRTAFPWAAPAVWISLFCSQRRVQAFFCRPGSLARPGGRRGRQACTERSLGVFPRPVRSVPLVPPRRSFLGPSLDGPVLPPEARRGVLPPSRWIGASGRLWGRQVCTEGSRGVLFPGALPCWWRLPGSLPGWACFAPRGAYRRFAAVPVGLGASRRTGGAVRPAQRLPPRGAGGRFPLHSPPFFFAPYIKGKKINRSV